VIAVRAVFVIFVSRITAQGPLRYLTDVKSFFFLLTYY